MNTVMSIERASNPVCHVHMNLLEIQCALNVYHIQSTLGGGLEVDSNWIVLVFKIYVRLRLP